MKRKKVGTLSKIKLKSGVAYQYFYYRNGKRKSKYFPPGTPQPIIQSEISKIESVLVLEKARLRKIDTYEVLEKITIGELYVWFKNIKNGDIAESNLERHYWALHNFIFYAGSEFPVWKVTTKHIEEFKKYELSHGKTRAGINKDMDHLRRVFGLACKYKLNLNEIVFEKFKRVRRRLPDFLMPDEMEKIRAHLEGDENKLAWEITKWTGIRRSELIERSKKKHYNFETGYLFIDGKTRERYVPMHPELIAFLKTNKIFNDRKSDELLFRNKLETFSKAIGKAKRKSGVKKRNSSHLLRHSIATFLLYKGVDIRLVQEMLGHANIQQTAIYAQVVKEHLKTEIDKFEYK